MSELPLEERLSAYLDGELSPDEQAKVEKLLAGNAQARAILDGLRAASSAVKGLPRLKLDEDLSARVLATAERRMLAEAPLEESVTQSPSPAAPLWKTAARRFLSPRAVVWSATAIAVAILLSIYGPEEEKPAHRGPIAMDTEAAQEAPDAARLADESPRRDHDEFRAAAPLAAEESAPAFRPALTESTASAKEESLTAAPPRIAAKKTPLGISNEIASSATAPHLAAKSAPIRAKGKAVPAISDPGLDTLAHEGRGDDTSGSNTSGYEGKSKQLPQPLVITVHCYVASQSDAAEALEKILIAKTVPEVVRRDKSQQLEPQEMESVTIGDKKSKFQEARTAVARTETDKSVHQLDQSSPQLGQSTQKSHKTTRQQLARRDGDSLTTRATLPELQNVLAAINGQPAVFRRYEVDDSSAASLLKDRLAAFSDAAEPATAAPSDEDFRQSEKTLESSAHSKPNIPVSSLKLTKESLSGARTRGSQQSPADTGAADKNDLAQPISSAAGTNVKYEIIFLFHAEKPLPATPMNGSDSQSDD